MEHSTSPPQASKKDERLAFLLLTVVIFPLCAILTVAGYGFLVWVFQMIAGPPSGH